MTAIANVSQRDMLQRSVDLYVGDRTEAGITQIFSDRIQFTPHTDASSAIAMAASLSLREDQARALLQALVRHFEGGEDTRSLRRDYDAERKRVDLLIDKLANVLVVPS